MKCVLSFGGFLKNRIKKQESRIKKSDSPLIDTNLFHTERADETDFHRSFFYSPRD